MIQFRSDHAAYPTCDLSHRHMRNADYAGCVGEKFAGPGGYGLGGLPSNAWSHGIFRELLSTIHSLHSIHSRRFHKAFRLCCVHDGCVGLADPTAMCPGRVFAPQWGRAAEICGAAPFQGPTIRLPAQGGLGVGHLQCVGRSDKKGRVAQVESNSQTNRCTLSASNCDDKTISDFSKGWVVKESSREHCPGCAPSRQVTDFVSSSVFHSLPSVGPGAATPYPPKRALRNLPRLPLVRDCRANKNALRRRRPAAQPTPPITE